MIEDKYVVFMTHTPQIYYYNIFAKVLREQFNIASVAWVVGDLDLQEANKLSFDVVLDLNTGILNKQDDEIVQNLRSLEIDHQELSINLNIAFDRHYKREKWSESAILRHIECSCSNAQQFLNKNINPLLIVGEANTAIYRTINQITPQVQKVCPMVLGHFRDRFYFETDVLHFSWPDLFQNTSVEHSQDAIREIDFILKNKAGTQTQRMHVKKGTFGLKSKFQKDVFTNRVKNDINRLKAKTDSWDHKLVSFHKTNLFSSSVRVMFQIASAAVSRRYTSKVINFDFKFGVFFLHFQPEITVDGLGYQYANQVEAIRLISMSLPIGEKLVVKEHPLMVGKRPSSYYKTISQMRNVVLIDDKLNTFDLIENASYLVSITGSAGLEAFFLGKTVFILGAIFHDQFPGVVKVGDIKNLPGLIKKHGMESKKVDSDDVCNVISRIWQNSYPGKLGHQYTVDEMDTIENRLLIANAFKNRFKNIDL